MSDDVIFLVTQLENCSSEANDIIAEIKLAKDSMKGQLVDRLDSNLKEIKETIKHLEMESSDMTGVRKWKKVLKELKLHHENAQSAYLSGGDEESGLFENDADAIVRKQTEKLKRANMRMTEAHDYGIKTNEELHRMSEKMKGSIKQKNDELLGELHNADGILGDMKKIISRNKRTFYGVFIGMGILVLFIIIMKLRKL